MNSEWRNGVRESFWRPKSSIELFYIATLISSNVKRRKGPPKNFELWSNSTKFWKCAFFYQPCHLSFQESSPRIRNAQVNKERYCEVHILPCIPSSFFSCHITRLDASLLPTSFCHWNQSLYPYPIYLSLFKTYWRFYIACTFISSIQCSDSWLEPKMSLRSQPCRD